MPKCVAVSMSLVTDWLHWFTPMPPYHNGSQRSHRTFHIVPWQSHHTFKTLILHIQQIHPSISWTPISNCQCAFPPEASNMFHLLNNPHFYLKTKTCSTWRDFFPATIFRPPAVHGEDLPHLKGQVISNKWDHRVSEERFPVIQICYFFLKKVLKLKTIMLKVVGSTPTTMTSQQFFYQKSVQRVFLEFVPARVRVLALLPSQLYSAPSFVGCRMDWNKKSHGHQYEEKNGNTVYVVKT